MCRPSKFLFGEKYAPIFRTNIDSALYFWPVLNFSLFCDTWQMARSPPDYYAMTTIGFPRFSAKRSKTSGDFWPMITFSHSAPSDYCWLHQQLVRCQTRDVTNCQFLRGRGEKMAFMAFLVNIWSMTTANWKIGRVRGKIVKSGFFHHGLRETKNAGESILNRTWQQKHPKSYTAIELFLAEHNFQSGTHTSSSSRNSAWRKCETVQRTDFEAKCEWTANTPSRRVQRTSYKRAEL